MIATFVPLHLLQVRTARGATVGTCSCGRWEISINQNSLEPTKARSSDPAALVARNHELHLSRIKP